MVVNHPLGGPVTVGRLLNPGEIGFKFWEGLTVVTLSRSEHLCIAGKLADQVRAQLRAVSPRSGDRQPPCFGGVTRGSSDNGWT